MVLDKVIEGAEQVFVVGQRSGHGQSAGVMHGDPIGDQAARMDQHSGGDALLKPSAAQRARLVRDAHEHSRQVVFNAAFMGNDGGFDIGCRVFEVDRAEALLGRLFEIFRGALVTRVLRHHEMKICVGLDQFTALIQRQDTALVGEWMDNYVRVLARLDDFVQIADRAVARR